MPASNLQPLPVPGSVLTRFQQAAALLIGTPYIHGGRSREDGLDCWGLVVELYRHGLGIEVDPFLGVAPHDRVQMGRCSVAIVAGRSSCWLEVESGRELPGDVVLFRRHGMPLHIGVVLGPGVMIHSDPPPGVHQARYGGQEWMSRLEGFYRHHTRGPVSR